MADTATCDSQFAFVTYQGPKVPQDAKTRNLIRRRAMKDVAAARKKTGDHGRYTNRRQYPVFVGMTSTPAVTAEDLSILLSLAPLTGFRLGLAGLAISPSESFPITNSYLAPRLGSSKLVAFIPSRYGHASALTCATDCVLAKRRSMNKDGGTPGAETAVLVCYSNALKALQAALDDEAERYTPETLCAAQLLGIFELLSANAKRCSWMRHAGGATRLMEVRGIQGFETEFEMALLTAHVGPAVTEAFLSNKRCFLAEPGWLPVLHAAIRSDESLVDYTDLVLNLWGHLVGGPGHFKMTTDLVCSTVPPPQKAIEDLIDWLMGARDMLYYWMHMSRDRVGLPISAGRGPEKWQDAAVFPPAGGPPGDATQLALRGTYATCRMLKARLLVALAPVRFRHLEVEAQDLATRIMSLGEQLSSTADCGGSLVKSLFMSQGSWIAQAIIDTSSTWGNIDSSHEGMIGVVRFEAWCQAMGRELPGHKR